MQALRDVLVRQDETVPLDVAALQLATIEYPDLDVSPYLVLLDSHAAELRDRVNPAAKGPEFVQDLAHYLAGDLGFAGNSDDYYNPANSCLNEVLTRRTGIPITLCILYIEVARRLGREVQGIGLPGHFIASCRENDRVVYFDPFNGGTLLSESQCFALARSFAGSSEELASEMLRPVSKRHTMIRMLNNLRAVYLRKSDHRKLVKVLDLLIEAQPGSSDDYRQRAICLTELEQFRAALQDFGRYLQLAPEAPDRADVEQQMGRIRHWLAKLN